MRLFRFDPFAVRPKEECTVGALRAKAAAAGVDTSPTPVHPGLELPTEPVRIIDLAARVSGKASA